MCFRPDDSYGILRYGHRAVQLGSGFMMPTGQRPLRLDDRDGHGQFMRFCRLVMCFWCCVAAGIERDLCILNKDLGKYDFQHKQHRSHFPHLPGEGL